MYNTVMTEFSTILEEVVSEYNRDDLDCDGQSRVFHWALANRGVTSEVKFGILNVYDKGFPIHYWVTFPHFPGYVLDTKLIKWFPDVGVLPNGLYEAKDWPQVKYTYIGTDKMPVLDDVVVLFMLLR